MMTESSDTESALVRAQIAGGDGDEALYGGHWETALGKYNLAATLCQEAIPTADAKTHEMLQKLVVRYLEKAQQIQDYLESTKSILVPEESFGEKENEISGPGENLQDGDVSYIPFGILHEEEEKREEVLEKPQDTITTVNVLASFWDRIEKLLNMLPSPRHTQNFYVTRSHPVPGDTLDTSFIVVPGNEEDLGLPRRLRLSNEPAEIKPNPQKSEITLLNTEIERLKNQNRILHQQNTKLQKMCNTSAGMHDLLQENTMLKKSISNFRHQVQKHTEQWQSMMISRPQNSLRPVSPMTMISEDRPRPTLSPVGPSRSRTSSDGDEHLSRRVSDLELTTHNLSKKLEEKREIIELTKYKKKYEKIIQNARTKKQKETQSVVDISTASSDILEIPSIDTYKHL